MRTFNVAIVGATGVVGETMLEILAERGFPIKNLYLIASENSAGKSLMFNGKDILVTDLTLFDFNLAQIAFFSAGSSVSAAYAPKAAACGCVVIDNTSYFRMDEEIPLVVPEVNPEAIAQYKNKNIIANPNCSTIQMVVALKPIYDLVGITRINVATYQSVSGTGKAAIEELAQQTLGLFNNNQKEAVVYPKTIAFNVLPKIDELTDNGYTIEEMKMIKETKKIFNDPNIKVNPTAVRVPVFYGHSEAVHIETERKITQSEARALLTGAPGIIVMDEPDEAGGFPTPMQECQGTDAVYVGRIREDLSHPLGLNLWVVADNLRKGAALNSIQIAEILIENYL